MAVAQIGEQIGLDGFPVESLAYDEVGRREVQRDQIGEEPEVSRQHQYICGNAHGGQAQTAADGLGDLAGRDTLLGNRVPRGRRSPRIVSGLRLRLGWGRCSCSAAYSNVCTAAPFPEVLAREQRPA